MTFRSDRGRERRKDLLGVTLAALAIAALWLLCSSNCRGQWEWTSAAAHHAAIVQVRAGNAGGTGTLFATSGQRGFVITATHVIEGRRQATAIWRNGHTSTGPIIAYDPAAPYGADVAVFVVQPPAGAVTIPLATSPPPVGAALEICGYGGPSNTLRTFRGTCTHPGAWRDDMLSRSFVISGDSGGAILAGQPPQLVGVVAGGHHLARGPVEGGSHWPLNYPTRGAGVASVLTIVQQCGPYGCPQPGAQSLPSYGRQIGPAQGYSSPTAPPRIDPQRLPTPDDYQQQPGQPIEPPAAEGWREGGTEGGGEWRKRCDALAEKIAANTSAIEGLSGALSNVQQTQEKHGQRFDAVDQQLAAIEETTAAAIGDVRLYVSQQTQQLVDHTSRHSDQRFAEYREERRTIDHDILGRAKDYAAEVAEKRAPSLIAWGLASGTPVGLAVAAASAFFMLRKQARPPRRKRRDCSDESGRGSDGERGGRRDGENSGRRNDPSTPRPLDPSTPSSSGAFIDFPPPPREPDPVRVVATDSPPPPQSVRTRTQFTPVNVDDTDEALAWAVDQLGRKFPGSVSYTQTLQGLMDQYRNAKK